MCESERTDPLKVEFPITLLSPQGIVLSAFYWGYVLTQVVGGSLSDRFGGDMVQWMAGVVWSLATLSSIYLAQVSIWPLVAARFMTGLAQGQPLRLPSNWNSVSATLSLCARHALPSHVQPGRLQGPRTVKNKVLWHLTLWSLCRVRVYIRIRQIIHRRT